MQSRTSDKTTTLSRRGFIKGALGTAAVIGSAAVLDAAGGIVPFVSPDQCSAFAAPSAKDLDVLNVGQGSVFTTEECEYIDDFAQLAEVTASAKLPYGTVLWASDDDVAACLLPCDTSDPLTQVGLLSLADGSMQTVLDQAVGHDDNFEIYDVRANSKGAIWVESDILCGEWRLYTARVDNMSLGGPQLVAQGDSFQEMPTMAISGNYAFWQLTPSRKAGKQAGDSVLMRVPFGFGEDEAKAVLESKGRFACAPSTSPAGIAVAPRADVSGTYYTLTHVDAESGEVDDTLTLPSSMKPSFVAYGSTGFSFAFEDIYSYGDGISNLGTYTPADGDPKGEWFHFARTPFTTPAWSDGWFVVKSTTVVAAIDLKSRRYFTISPENATQAYGEFLATSSVCGRVVTYSNIDYTPLNGQRIKECNVRIWRLK